MQIYHSDNGYTCSITRDYVSAVKDKRLTMVVSKHMPYEQKIEFKYDMICLVTAEGYDLDFIERI